MIQVENQDNKSALDRLVMLLSEDEENDTKTAAVLKNSDFVHEKNIINENEKIASAVIAEGNSSDEFVKDNKSEEFGGIAMGNNNKIEENDESNMPLPEEKEYQDTRLCRRNQELKK